MRDGSVVRLETISEDHDPSDAVGALAAIHEAEIEARHVTGLLYFDPDRPTFAGIPVSAATAHRDDDRHLRPDRAALDQVVAQLRG